MCSADAMQAVQLKFKSKEAAILFAERQGYEYTIQEPKQPRWMGKSYSENFSVCLRCFNCIILIISTSLASCGSARRSKDL